MKKTSEPITFFGSGPVAAESLRRLAQDFVIEAVITKPQPPHHKQPFPVLALAEELGLKVFTSSNQQDLSELFAKRPVQSKIGVIIDHGVLVARDVIDYFPLGIVNSHFSLLPRLRGADPISFAILNGDSETGVSLMLIVEKLDEGRLLAQRALPIAKDVTTPTLTNQLIELSHQLLIETLPHYMSGQLRPYPQPDLEPTYSRKLTKEDGQIDWTKSAEQLEREVRAYAGWPRSRTVLGQHKILITGAHVAKSEDSAEPGTIWRSDDRQLGVHTAAGILVIDSLIPAGKKAMSAAAFLAGYKL